MAELYRQLVAKCSFGEFCAAYEASGLVDLFDAKGMRGGRQGILYLEDVLAGTHKSVWDLKQYVVADGRDMIPSVAADYGFFNCKDEAERLELKEVYVEFFARRGANPIQLHEAAV